MSQAHDPASLADGLKILEAQGVATTVVTEMSRKDFAALSPVAAMAFVKRGGKVKD